MGRVNLHSPWAAPTHPKPIRKAKLQATQLLRRPLRFGPTHSDQEQPVQREQQPEMAETSTNQ